MLDDVRVSKGSVRPTHDRSADSVLFMVLAVYASVYCALILIHQQFFVLKTNGGAGACDLRDRNQADPGLRDSIGSPL
jgi:hypothetical protein